MGVHIATQRNGNCSEQGFKCLQCSCHGIDSQLIFLNQYFAMNVLSCFLYAWFAQIDCILEQVNKEILRRR